MIFENKSFAVMGIVNVTDDSFYDGGRYNTSDAAVAQALKLIADGADIIDVGGASTRPGAELLSADEEAARVLPVVEELARRGVNVPISVDTVWSSVACASVKAGASIVNDVSAGRIDPDMPEVAADIGCVVVLTHSRKTPKDMQVDPCYGDVVKDVAGELMTSVETFKRAGVCEDKIIIDPGIGFAKSVEHNVALIRGADVFMSLGYPVLYGLSRKSFIGAITGRDVCDRLPGTLAATAAAYMGGARIFRVHDVRETVDFLNVLSAINSPSMEH